MKEFHPFRLDTVNQCLWRRTDTEAEGDERISLTPKAFALLSYMVEHPGRLITQDELLEALWPNTFVQPEVLKSHILDVRNALEDSAKRPRFIETLRRRGYQFIAPVQEERFEAKPWPESPTINLVGRDAALAELKSLLTTSSRKQRQLVFITGEPGIGKTALADEFQRQAAAVTPNLRVARGQCVEGYGGKEAYYPMLEALGQLCAGPDADAVVQILAAQAPTWLVQFPSLIKRDQRATLQREIMGATRERMLREISEAIETIATEKPLLLVLEDLHWSDTSTMDLISCIARRRNATKLMVIGTYRPVDVVLANHPMKTVKQDLLIHRLCHELALRPLEEPEVARYLALESRGFAVPEGLAGLIYRHTEGNPLFMVAAISHLCDRGLIALVNGAWQMKLSLEKIDLQAPDSLRQMIELQVERLGPDEQRVFEIASVLRKFSLSVTLGAAVSNLHSDTVEELLEGLARRHQIIRPAGFKDYKTGPSPCYEFVHVLYREVMYSRIGHARRRKLHQSVGASVEMLHVSSEAEVATELAYQFEQGGDWPRAVKYLVSAAETAGRRFEPLQAAEILERALEHIGKLPETDRARLEIEVLEKLSTIYVASGDARVEQTFAALVTRASHYGLIDAQARALLAWAFFLSWVSSERALALLEQALSLSEFQQDPLLRTTTRVRCFALRIWATGWKSQHVDEFRQPLDEILRAAPRSILPHYLVDRGFIQWISSAYSDARRSLLESRAIVFQTIAENPYLDTAYLLGQCVLCMNLLFLGNWGEALREIEDTITMVEKNAQSTWGQALRLYKAWVYLQAQDFLGTLTTCDSALPLVQDPEPHPHPDHPAPYPFEFWMCLVLRGMAETALGNHQSALRHLTVAEIDMQRQVIMLGWYWHVPLELAFAEAWLANGDLQQAKAHAEKLLDIALANPERTWQALAWEVSTRIAIAQGDLQRARELIAKALSAINGFDVPLAAWRVHATTAELHQNSGNRKSAEDHLRLSRETLLKLANSLPSESPLRETFLSSTRIRKTLGSKTEQRPVPGR
ncbi:MAG TPA: AAA family ATPase [Candidatus Sulfotelmatobacter sp.]|nr:AAA family ATPase [Candidatus Sulfotelmatobacter sp.]